MREFLNDVFMAAGYFLFAGVICTIGYFMLLIIAVYFQHSSNIQNLTFNF